MFDIKYYEQPKIWDKELEQYQLQVQYDILNLIPDAVGTLLDVGCGDGVITNTLPKHIDATGLDISQEAIRRVKGRKIIASVLNIPCQDKSFDLVMSNDMLEHIQEQDYRNACRELQRVAEKYIIITVPYMENLESRIIKCLQCGARYHLNYHQRNYSVKSICNLFDEFKLRSIVFSGDEWRNDEDWFVWTQKLEGMETITPENSLCVKCGHINSAQDIHINNPFVIQCRTLQAKRIAEEPKLLEKLTMRTEIICLFQRDSEKKTIVNKLASTKCLNYSDAYRVSEFRPLNCIDFKNYKRYQWNHLPNYNRLPVFVSDSPVEEGLNGICYNFRNSNSNKIWDLKTGFWLTGESNSYQYIISGQTEDEATLSLYKYDNFKGYCKVKTKRVYGNFNVAFKVDEMPFSQYGLVFCLQVSGTKVKIKTIVLKNHEEFIPQVQYLKEKFDYLKRECDGVDVYFSTKKYNEDIPCYDWFNHVEFHEASEIGASPDILLKRFIAFITNQSFDQTRKNSKLSLEALSKKHVLNLGTRSKQKVRSILLKMEQLLYKHFPKKKTVTMLVPDDRIDRRVLFEARALVKLGWRVVVIAATAREGEEFLDESLFPDVAIVRIDTSYVIPDIDRIKSKLERYTPQGYDWREVYWYHYHFLIKALQYPADIIVAHDLPVLAAAVIAANFHKARLVYDAHELYPEQFHFGEERSELYRQVETKLILEPNLVITVNESIANEMAKRYQIQPPEVILNAPDLYNRSLPIKSKNLLRISLGINESTRILLFQGSISLSRNLENLVEAMSLIKRDDVVLVIMGPDGGKYNELQEIAQKLTLFNTKVFFHPSVSQDNILDYTASADVGIIPYPHIDLNSLMCSPNKLFEYLVASLPILANKSPELVRFVSDQQAGMVHPMNNALEIAEGIDKVFALDLKQIRQNMERKSSNFIWDVQAKKLVNLYKTVLG